MLLARTDFPQPGLPVVNTNNPTFPNLQQVQLQVKLSFKKLP